MHDDSELQRLTARVDALERDVAFLKYGTAPAAAPEPAASAPAPGLTPPTVPPAPTASTAPSHVEAVVGGRGLLYAGALLVAVGVASFLKIAFDRGWIGPPMRVALGVLAGVLLIAGAQLLRKRLHPVFADTLIGLGAAIEYLSLYAAGVTFALLPLSVTAIGMIVVTFSVGVLAYRDGRQPLAFVALIGGEITPLLLGNSPPNTLAIYIYLAVLSAGAIVLAELRGWRAISLVALIATVFYWVDFNFGLFSSTPVEKHPVAERVAIAVVIYALYASSTAIAHYRARKTDVWLGLTMAGNAAWFFFTVQALDGSAHVRLAVVFLAIAAVHLLAGARWNQRIQFWLATIAVSFAIPPVCYSFSALAPDWVLVAAYDIAWAAVGTAAGILAVRSKDLGLMVLAGGLFAAAALNGLARGDVPAPFLLNERFLSLAAVAAGMAMVRREALAHGVFAARGGAWVKVVVDFLALVAISPEAYRLGELLQPKAENDAAALVALSIAWGLYGAVLIGYGIAAKNALSRWEGLALIGLTVLKVLLVDLTGVDVVLRVVVALVVGVVMLVLAFLYQSRMRGAAPGPTEQPK